jgi:hypothetical protein
MRWISNLDSVTWTFQKARPIKLYGLEKTRALLALCALIEGVPMLFQGDEDPSLYGGSGPSSIDALAKIYRLRKTLRPIREGSSSHASVRATGGVFACVRSREDEQALVFISLNPQSVESRLAAEPGLSLAGTWTDSLGPEVLGFDAAPRLHMAPFQVRVLTRQVSPHAEP